MQEEVYQDLFTSLNKIEEINEEEKNQLIDAFTPISCEKGEYISEYGKVNDKLAFVAKGYCRVYVIDPDGNEVTIHMAGNCDFVGAITSFLTQKPSEEYVQAVTDTAMLTITYKRLNELYSTSHKWERIGRRIMEGLFVRKQQRVISFIQLTAEERYKQLMSRKPDMILSVPNQYTASFLGITPETLSRIRAKIV